MSPSPTAYSGLRGPFPFNRASIEHQIGNSEPGTFTLGVLRGNQFEHLYVERSDTDVGCAIFVHLDKAARYSHFYYEYFANSHGAYEMECKIFHRFMPPDNSGVHPIPARNATWKCPVPGCTA